MKRLKELWDEIDWTGVNLVSTTSPAEDLGDEIQRLVNESVHLQPAAKEIARINQLRDAFGRPAR